MKNSVIREMSTAELQNKLREEQVVNTRLRLGHTVSPLENPMRLRESRRVIARMNTELVRRQKEQNN